MLGIYIHIPFCESRCYYCDFCSNTINLNLVKDYISYLKMEIKLYDAILKNNEIDTIFIGGGTPSSISEYYIEQICDEIFKYNISKNLEFSIESNPNSLNLRNLKKYKNLGINRISMGAQSFNDDILKSIGRIHKSSDIFKAVDSIKEAGFENFNLDLMLALPNQKFSNIEDSIKKIKILNPTHISYYSLIIEEGTLMSKIFENKKELFPNEDEDRKMYHYVVDALNFLNYKQYEISNFAKDRFRSQHNLKYWKLKDYLGLGLSASSNFKNIRYTNFYDFKNYFNAISKNVKPIDFKEILSKKDRINEYAIMGLRLNEGINFKEFKSKFNEDFNEIYKNEIEKNINLKLLAKNKDSIYLTKLGRDISNRVELDFMK